MISTFCVASWKLKHCRKKSDSVWPSRSYAELLPETMSSGSRISCKLPLLDGDAGASPQVIAVDVVSGDPGNLRRLYKHDEPISNSYLCTAWALLLRCYTGQDHVCFHFQGIDNKDEASVSASSRQASYLIHLALRETEPLSKNIERTTSAISPGLIWEIAAPEHGDEHGSQLANTKVLIHTNKLGEAPVAGYENEVSKVRSPKSVRGFNKADISLREKSLFQHATRLTD